MRAPQRVEDTDEQLMTRAAKGDRQAFHGLVERHGPWVLNLALKTTGSRGAAEDVTQETFFRVWRAAPKWQLRAKFTTWLYRITVNLCLDEKRRRTFVALDGIEEPADDRAGSDGGRTLRDRQRAGFVRLEILRLPERQRMALVLFHYQGHSVAEIMAIMEASEGAIESLLTRARATLKAQLADLAADLIGD